MKGDRWTDRLAWWLADRLPRKVCYYVVIRVWARATCGKYTDKTPDEVTWSMALKAWEEK